jgi:TetR/AcrR family transcriptional repressor of nem operon
MARPISFDPELALEKAMELFWSRGYHEVSVEDIVQATGLNRHSLYARYGSKFGLLKAALERYREVVMERIREVLTGPGTARERVERLLALRKPEGDDGVFRDMLERGCFALRMTAEMRDNHPDLGADLDEFGDLLETLLADVIRQGQANDEFRKDRTPEDLASVLVGGFMLPLIYTPAARRIDAFVHMLD